MKLDIILVDLALVALVFVPYILFILMGRREEKILKKKFLEEASKRQLTIEEKEFWNNNIIGFDKTKATILLVQKRRTEIRVETVDLREVKGCEILQEVQTLKLQKRTEDILQRIDLQLKLYNNSIRIITLYNCEETYSQEYELKHAEHWNKKINSLISFRPTVDSAA